MNNKKICFIIASDNNRILDEMLLYIDNLTVPNGMVSDTQVITGAESITQAYNFAMNQSDAKYKIYLHQDLFILNKNFICDILEIFSNNPDVGMIGTIGCKMLPESGIWWESKDNVGKTFEDRICFAKELSLGQIEEDIEDVMSIDGQIMITQYDIPWREDICTGWHFYDESQSLEFIRKGYRVVVAKQDKPWFLHECGMNINSGYEETRQLFLREYKKKFLIVMGDDVCYDILNKFALEFIYNLEKMGYCCDVVNLENGGLSTITKYFEKTYTAIIGFQTGIMDIKLENQNKYMVEFIHGPKYNFIFDHPLFVGSHFNVDYPDYHMFTVDRNHKNYVNNYYKNINYCRFLPPAALSMYRVDGNNDKYDVVFIGTCYDYRECLKIIAKCDTFTKKIASAYLGILRKQSSLTQEEALKLALDKYNIEVSDDKFNEMLMELGSVSLCITYYYREKIINTLSENGINVHVFGKCWNEIKTLNSSVTVHDNLTTEMYMKVLSQTKVGLNIMPWNKDGFTERIPNIMIEGAVCACDNSRYVNENFIDNKEIIMYDINDIQTLAKKIKQILADNELRKNIANNGKTKALNEHTWKNRVISFLESL